VTGPVVIVTGAARGIGRACVDLFAQRGYRVVAVDLDAMQLNHLSTIDGVATFAGDVATEETNVEMVLLATQRFGRLDAAVLNAGAGGTLPLESDGAIDRQDRILAVNVRGVALGIRSSVLEHPHQRPRAWTHRHRANTGLLPPPFQPPEGSRHP
jgi:NAD(P)-dependent dehydrogenase (short-subunit alcohol dehydrogenase family)